SLAGGGPGWVDWAGVQSCKMGCATYPAVVARNAVGPLRRARFFPGVRTIMSKGQSLQDPFLKALRRERVPEATYLVNGIKLQGTLESFDQFVVLLRNEDSQMVYKHAISTVVPARNVRM